MNEDWSRLMRCDDYEMSDEPINIDIVVAISPREILANVELADDFEVDPEPAVGEAEAEVVTTAII